MTGSWVPAKQAARGGGAQLLRAPSTWLCRRVAGPGSLGHRSARGPTLLSPSSCPRQAREWSEGHGGPPLSPSLAVGLAPSCLSAAGSGLRLVSSCPRGMRDLCLFIQQTALYDTDVAC